MKKGIFIGVLFSVFLIALNLLYENNRALYDKNYQVWLEKQAEAEANTYSQEVTSEAEAESIEADSEEVRDSETEYPEYSELTDEEIKEKWQTLKNESESLQTEAANIQKQIEDYEKQLEVFEMCKQQSQSLTVNYSEICNYKGLSFAQKYDLSAISSIEKENNQYSAVNEVGNAVGFVAGVFTGYIAAAEIDENNVYYQQINGMNNFFAEKFEECTAGIQCSIREIEGILNAYSQMFSDVNSLEKKLLYQDIIVRYGDGSLPETELDNNKNECIRYLYQYTILMDEAIRVYSSALTDDASTNNYLNNLQVQKQQAIELIDKLDGGEKADYLSDEEVDMIVQGVREKY